MAAEKTEQECQFENFPFFAVNAFKYKIKTR